MDLNFGPKPFISLDYWLEELDIDMVVRNAWGKEVKEGRPDCVS